MLPADPYLLVSLVNMKLRDENSDLQDFCSEQDVSRTEIEEKLAKIGYCYDERLRMFINTGN